MYVFMVYNIRIKKCKLNICNANFFTRESVYLCKSFYFIYDLNEQGACRVLFNMSFFISFFFFFTPSIIYTYARIYINVVRLLSVPLRVNEKIFFRLSLCEIWFHVQALWKKKLTEIYSLLFSTRMKKKYDCLIHCNSLYILL